MVKLLGIKIDAGLTFNGHMETVCKRASHKLNALSMDIWRLYVKEPLINLMAMCYHSIS